MDTQRYVRQLVLRELGAEGQRRLGASAVLVVGCGALGTNAAQLLVRAGVGRLRIVDRDFVEEDNLHRQVLFTEADAKDRQPKAVAACRRLAEANSTVTLEPVVADITRRNVERLLEGVAVAVDATDNMETRFLLNDACVKHSVPWVYGGAVGTMGMTMTVVPRRTACLRCVMEQPPAPGVLPTCETMGVLNAAPAAVAAFEVAEALKIIVGNDIAGDLLMYFDVWHRTVQTMSVSRRADCPACGQGIFEFLRGSAENWTICLCGRNAVQITPVAETALDLERMRKSLAHYGQVSCNGFLITLRPADALPPGSDTAPGSHKADPVPTAAEIVIFPDGRAIVKGTTDEAFARKLYARYVGV